MLLWLIYVGKRGKILVWLQLRLFIWRDWFLVDVMIVQLMPLLFGCTKDLHLFFSFFGLVCTCM